MEGRKMKESTEEGKVEDAKLEDEKPEEFEITECEEKSSLSVKETEAEEVENRRPIKSKAKRKFRDAPSPPRKAKLRTSKDVYDRLKWDCESITIKDAQELDLSSIHIGYKDRFLGICEIPFKDFVPLGGLSRNEELSDDGDEEHEEYIDGEIPFHRVYYFRTGGPPEYPFIGRNGEVKVREDNWPEGSLLIWDRDTRTDLIFQSGNSSST